MTVSIHNFIIFTKLQYIYKAYIYICFFIAFSLRVLLISGVTLLLFSCSADKQSSEISEILIQLDEEIDKASEYSNSKDAKITSLKNSLNRETDENKKFKLRNSIIAEYETFSSDSALRYINLNLNSPALKQNNQQKNKLLLKKAEVCSHAGLFRQSFSILQNIPRNEIDSTLLESYYSIYFELYQYQIEYAKNDASAKEYEKLRKAYSDSVNQITPENSFRHITNAAPELIRNNHIDDVITSLSEEAEMHKSGTREYSIIHSILAFAYSRKNDLNNTKKHLALSAISDIQGSIKENTALRELATHMFDEGDILRANKYLKFSISDATFYSARMRNEQASRMLPLIDNAYYEQQNNLKDRLNTLNIIISVLAVILLLSGLFILKILLKERRQNKMIKENNDELKTLSYKLREANSDLEIINDKLTESDKIKGIYTVLFMETCSSTISTLQTYHKSLYVLSMQSSKAALIKKLESHEIIDKALTDFYQKFDEAILHIYPNFLEKFNRLLKPDQQIVLKKGELLNTELRTFALIRIGITDSSHIARFLRCSITTIYTYRSKVKKRAIDPSTFEEDIMKIK